jgi:hypothetical protein
VLFMARDADDGSKAPWEMVQPGMTWEQVGEILARSPPYPTQQSAFFDKSYWYRECVYRHYVLSTEKVNCHFGGLKRPPTDVSAALDCARPTKTQAPGPDSSPVRRFGDALACN